MSSPLMMTVAGGILPAAAVQCRLLKHPDRFGTVYFLLRRQKKLCVLAISDCHNTACSV